MTSRRRLGLLFALVLVSGCTSSAPTGPSTAGASAVPAGTTPPPATPTAATPTAAPTPTASPTPVPTPFVPYTIDEPTRYEGTLRYDCAEDGCWRQGSTIGHPSEIYYPEPDANNAEIASLLDDIGLGTSPIEDDATGWRTMRALWAWLHEHASFMTAAPEAWEYLGSISTQAKPEHWPSISDIASTYARYQTIPWGACNSKAFTFAILAYRVGLSPDRVAAAYFKSPDNSVQHLYVVFRSGAHWYYVDPTCNPSTASLPEAPANMGCNTSADYEHPFTLALLPGSKLTRAMLVR